MGIPRLTDFMEKIFKGWKPVNCQVWDHVIIDGQSVCLMLYRKSGLEWALAGEYDKFQAQVEEILKQFKNPIVLFDGVVSDQGKAKANKISYAEKLTKMQSGQERGTKETLLPLLIVPAFIDALKNLKIRFFVTDGKADREIAALANEKKCPVLSGDSDFFIFNLKHGYISFDRFLRKVNSVFFIEDFMKQFNLREYELCLLIPAYFRNEYAEGMRIAFLKNLTQYNRSLETYFNNSENPFPVSRSDYQDDKQSYCDLKVEEKERPDLPKWFRESYKAGNFLKPILCFLEHEKFRLPQIIEATMTYESAWMVSRAIRQQLYHIMGIPEVTEVLRKKSEIKLIEEKVLSLPLNPPILIQDELFVVDDKKRLSDLVLQILRCQERCQEISTFPANFQLPLAATVYWYQALQEPKQLAASLLLSFMVCSKNIMLEKEFSVEPSTEPSHLKNLHTFAQWQCVYFDAMTLNSLAREPFPTTGPGCLYSGNVAMYYASLSTQDLTKCLKEIFPRPDSEDHRLFDQLLHVVTGSDEKIEAIDTA